jgi:Fe-S-cluster containining protein
MVAREEYDRICRHLGHALPDAVRMPDGPVRTCTVGDMCPMLSAEGRCTVYALRPALCRLWFMVEDLPCPYGCRPERYLTAREALSVLLLSGALGEMSEGEAMLRAATWPAEGVEALKARLRTGYRVRKAEPCP